jgi:phosphoribosylformylglycinamidine cyclo-ligase
MTTYREAGVDIARGEEAVQRLRQHVETTFTEHVLQGIGAFAGALDERAVGKHQHPVFLATIDGVGTKTLLAAQVHRWEGIGLDLVHHCANDLVCHGAAPLLFLDYVASSVLDPVIVEELVRGMSAACRSLSCVLLGGETAEMPAVYHAGAYDVVGAMIGVAERQKLITGKEIRAGDILIGLPSNGLHTNGYSLARKIIADAALSLDDAVPELGATLAGALLRPHTLYAPLVLKLHREVGLKGVAHITGGGIHGNLRRVLPPGLRAEVRRGALPTPPIFTFLARVGRLSQETMDEAFNQGVGMVLVIAREVQDAILLRAPGSAVLGTVY